MPPKFQPTAYPGTVHQFTPRLTAFEPQASPPRTTTPNTLLWIGGLGDSLLTVSYPLTLASLLPPTWSLAQVLLSSAGSGWGTTTLAADASELAHCVAYFRDLRPDSKIVLMGHSTGCQDCMEYVVGPGSADRPPVDGIVLQAPVSDREALAEALPGDLLGRSIELARDWCRAGKGDDVLPRAATRHVLGSHVSAKRWLSLASPDKDGDDDYFSSDLPMWRIRASFGKIPRRTPLLVLFGGEDEFVPGWVDRKGLVGRWMDVVREGGGVVDDADGGVVPGAHHNLMEDGEEVVGDLCRRVVRYLENLGDGEFGMEEQV
ncbi:DUF1749-domain-containing protein [Saccharata proteae CBS 121410]|uniref:DUF1749-domain-containing protein n=1 Tax=Saccharata proteae CBS 121410 TaxID=1314787 RepID=A0A9P4LZZ7_9PEZI|nr:DUF1749-domain-containing protein [Saccharata proteae CBS 121410]